MRDRRIEIQGLRLIEESESVLDGRYVFTLRAARLPVPPWAWLSALAHGSTGKLLELAGGSHAGSWGLADRFTTQWQVAVTLLAGELLTTAGRLGWDVGDLQRSVLVDLELRSTDGASVVDASRFVEAVRGALARFQDSSHP